MKSLGIIHCNLESLLLACEGVRGGFPINTPSGCPCGINYDDLEELIFQSDFITFFGQDIPERLLLKGGSKAIPPIHSLDTFKRWREIARKLGMEIWDGPLPEPPFGDLLILSILVARSRKGEIKHYPPSRLFNLDRQTYWGHFKPKKEILWEVWDATSRISQEIGYVGLASFTFIYDGRLSIQSIALNTIKNNEWVEGSTLTSPFQQVFRGLVPVYLGETDTLIGAASIRVQGEGIRSIKGILNTEGTELLRFDREMLIIIRDQREENIREKVKRVLKIMRG